MIGSHSCTLPEGPHVFRLAASGMTTLEGLFPEEGGILEIIGRLNLKVELTLALAVLELAGNNGDGFEPARAQDIVNALGLVEAVKLARAISMAAVPELTSKTGEGAEDPDAGDGTAPEDAPGKS